MRKTGTFIGIYLGGSVLTGLAGLVLCYPRFPSSAAQWAGLFLLPLPAMIVLEAIGTWIWSNPFAQRIDSFTRNKSLSFLRIAYGVLMMSGCIALALAGAWAWQHLRTFFA